MDVLAAVAPDGTGKLGSPSVRFIYENVIRVDLIYYIPTSYIDFSYSGKWLKDWKCISQSPFQLTSSGNGLRYKCEPGDFLFKMLQKFFLTGYTY